MRVRVYPSDATGCGTYRCTMPAEAARQAGCDVTVAEVPSPRDNDGQVVRPYPIRRHPHNPRLVAANPVDADVIVFQRPVEEEAVAIIGQLRDRGHAIVVEVDDDLERLDSRHPAHRKLNPKLSPSGNWQHLRACCALADLVTVTTPALAERYGKHGRVAILPNCVPDRLLDMPRDSDGRTVGWRGFTPTHPGDLRATGGGVADAVRRHDAHFLQIGPPDGVRQQLNLDAEPEATGPLWNIDDYYQALGRLDVGILPLADTQFNQAKSWLGGIEYAARGVPFVASPTREYQTLAARGVGMLAGYRGRDWRRQISILLADPTLRETLAERARKVVRERHTFSTQGHKWPEAWENALHTARRRHRDTAPLIAA